MSGEAIVTRFVEEMNRLDWDSVYGLMSDDIAYHNIPFCPLEGLDAVRGFFAAVGTISDCDWRILKMAACGDVVLTERLDEFTLDGRRISLPVMGIFRIRDGKIAEWRDYFDRASFEDQLGRPLG
jgi:limonene-1,2-epoxide hydrolase